MTVGVVVPQFHGDAELAIDFAKQAEQRSVDGVFVFDHLWAPMQTSGPSLSLWPLLAAIGAATTQVRVGTLVARVGIVSDDVLVRQALTAADHLGERLVVGLGIGDGASQVENEAYGLGWPSRAERLDRMAAVAATLKCAGITVWLGGRSQAVAELAVELGVGLNQWEPPTTSEALPKVAGELTWGGRVSADVTALAATVAWNAERGFSSSIVLIEGSRSSPEEALVTLSDSGVLTSSR